MLAALNCKYKIGYDVNPYALQNASDLGISTTTDLSEVENSSIDVVISNSALEHSPTPYEDISRLLLKLKPGGKVVFRVPHETLRWGYKPEDWNYHLFTWSPMALGNLFHAAGFVNIKVSIEVGKKPPMSRIFGSVPAIENISAKIYRSIRLILEEIGFRHIGVDGYSILIARKPEK